VLQTIAFRSTNHSGISHPSKVCCGIVGAVDLRGGFWVVQPDLVSTAGSGGLAGPSGSVGPASSP
jgi:hypothetical protein